MPIYCTALTFEEVMRIFFLQVSFDEDAGSREKDKIMSTRKEKEYLRASAPEKKLPIN